MTAAMTKGRWRDVEKLWRVGRTHGREQRGLECRGGSAVGTAAVPVHSLAVLAMAGRLAVLHVLFAITFGAVLPLPIGMVACPAL